MKPFTRLYDASLRWARHPHATGYLAGLSFAESSFFPIPPDVMLMPMALARPHQALWYAWVTTIFSTLGGLLGYAVGYWAFAWIEPWLLSLGYGAQLAQAQMFFTHYGVWVVFVAGFSPIPYKLFTLTAGAMQMPLLPFVLASLVGRGARFFLLALLMRWGGARYADRIRASVGAIGWLTVGLIGLYLGWRWFGAEN